MWKHSSSHSPLSYCSGNKWSCTSSKSIFPREFCPLLLKYWEWVIVIWNQIFLCCLAINLCILETEFFTNHINCHMQFIHIRFNMCEVLRSQEVVSTLIISFQPSFCINKSVENFSFFSIWWNIECGSEVKKLFANLFCPKKILSCIIIKIKLPACTIRAIQVFYSFE